MSTKRLDKTIIEGGRNNHNKWERRQSHAYVRAEEKFFCRKVAIDPEFAEDYIIDDAPHVYKEFKDKLKPLYRWLDKKIGQNWDLVYSDIKKEFDISTTPGRHVIEDHLLHSVARSELINGYPAYESFRKYYVDENNILQKTPKQKYKYSTINEKSFNYNVVENWLNGNMIGLIDSQPYWFMPNEGNWKAVWDTYNVKTPSKFSKTGYVTYPKYCLKYQTIINSEYIKTIKEYSSFAPRGYDIFNVNRIGYHWEAVDNPNCFKQRGKLIGDDFKFWNDLPNILKEHILEHTKDRK